MKDNMNIEAIYVIFMLIGILGIVFGYSIEIVNMLVSIIYTLSHTEIISDIMICIGLFGSFAYLYYRLHNNRIDKNMNETDSKFDLPLYFFKEIDGKEICRNMCLIEKCKLGDGRVILIGLLSENVDLNKDNVLREFFDKMR